MILIRLEKEESRSKYPVSSFKNYTSHKTYQLSEPFVQIKNSNFFLQEHFSYGECICFYNNPLRY